MHNIFFVSLVFAFIVAVRTQWPLESNENDCSTETDDYKEFWTWTRQQKELFRKSFFCYQSNFNKKNYRN